MRLFNTLTGAVEPLRPRDAGRVGIYVCGPTVQGPPHFGHARANLVPDVLRRFLEWSGHDVFLVRNITDIDDKILVAAQNEGRTVASLAERYTRVWEREIARLGIAAPDVTPRATGHIPEIQDLIVRLIETGAAYPAGGDVFFAVRAFGGYGKLSGRRPDELRAGARIAPDERKRDPLDFVLWKGAKPGEPSWSSPWGPGRPGWHIECSAMATRYLGADFDIHMGGTDLQFPHHENEIAQWEAATGTPFARMWVHNGMLTLDQTKMSKSVGNIISLAEAIDRYGPGALRMFYLRAHYRKPVDFSEARLDEAAAAYERLAGFVRATAVLDPNMTGDDGAAASDAGSHRDAIDAFREAMSDDLATPRALAGIYDLVAAGNQELEADRPGRAVAIRDVVLELAGVLGFDFAETAATDQRLIDGLVGELVALREEARQQRDFATSDRIRERLHKLGIELVDARDGPRWHLART
ncbi:MAG: cysteine--tRNA ligase [Actinobacteria bacterium]|nr:cysteine--tRNA ligase [Actinomycetota bacterium]